MDGVSGHIPSHTTRLQGEDKDAYNSWRLMRRGAYGSRGVPAFSSGNCGAAPAPVKSRREPVRGALDIAAEELRHESVVRITANAIAAAHGWAWSVLIPSTSTYTLVESKFGAFFHLDAPKDTDQGMTAKYPSQTKPQLAAMETREEVLWAVNEHIYIRERSG
jgi:hypothetical protein